MQPIQPTSRPRTLRRRLVAIVAATAAAAAAVALGVVFASPVAAATGDTHFFMDNRAFIPGPVDVFQSTRLPTGAFAARVDVTAQAGRLNEDAADIAAARVGRDNHLVVARDADVLHSVQGTDGAWSPFTTVATGQALPVLEIAAADVAGQLQVVVRTLGGGILHALRDSRGTWTPFGDIESQAGPLNPGFGPNIEHVAAAGFSNGRLQVVVDWDGTFLHTVRGTDGAWSAWQDVGGQTGRPDGGAAVFSVTAAEVSGVLHLVVNAGGTPFHAVRASNGTWTRLSSVYAQTGRPGSLTEVAVTEGPLGGELVLAIQACCTAADPERLIYTTRDPLGSWTAFQQFPAPREGAGGVDDLAVVAE